LCWGLFALKQIQRTEFLLCLKERGSWKRILMISQEFIQLYVAIILFDCAALGALTGIVTQKTSINHRGFRGGLIVQFSQLVAATG
jgi:hypothetical protein